MNEPVAQGEVFGFVRPSVDAHTLGISYVEQLLTECGYRVEIADARVCDAVDKVYDLNNVDLLVAWIRERRISRLGFSYRLDPRQAQQNFGRLVYQLRQRGLFEGIDGLRGLYFAGLPEACTAVAGEFGSMVEVFRGEESPAETLRKLRVPPERISTDILAGSEYDEWRLAFGLELVEKEEHRAISPPSRTGYAGFGTRRDSVEKRIAHCRATGQPPLMRAHVGPYRPNRVEALREFVEWTRSLARSGFLDVLSIGTSQLTQSRFGEDWGDSPNGGGVPIQTPAEYEEVWSAARPMLVRTYAGTRNIPRLAVLHEETLNIAWHALSFWWFCRIDGRGPNTVCENLRQHLETLDFIAASRKPFEPNIPHHFAFRGSDDVSFVASAYLAAKAAKIRGVQALVLQVMLNTPRQTWGVQDLAKARALLSLVRQLEEPGFRVYLQPRAGLDYFSPNLTKARAQLAAVAALIDDIEPNDPQSPAIVHVVSYSEASHLADPSVVDESVQITLGALSKYRRMRAAGIAPSVADEEEVADRTEELLRSVRHLVDAIERTITKPYSAEGLYRIFAAGFLPVPYLWEGRDEFSQAIDWSTRILDGGVKVVGSDNRVLGIEERVAKAVSNLSEVRVPLATAAGTVHPALKTSS